MRRKFWMCAPMILLLLTLTACKGAADDDDSLALRFREQYTNANYTMGTMAVTADYGERVYSYTMKFTWEKGGDMMLTLTEPDLLAGITARIQDGETRLEFDGAQLETGPLSPDGLSPMDAFPALVRYLTEGYLGECGPETLGEQVCLRLQYREPEAEPGTGLEGVLWLDRETGALVQGEIRNDGFTVLHCTFPEFSMG